MSKVATDQFSDISMERQRIEKIVKKEFKILPKGMIIFTFLGKEFDAIEFIKARILQEIFKNAYKN